MPLQNRVTPYGEIVAYPERGTFTGNRGILHDDHKQLTNRRWTNPAWIICQLEFKGWKRQVMTPHRWTELFFLDEATALAAGHRPCATCRREAFNTFKDCWQRGNPQAEITTIKHVDRQLHQERCLPKRQKRTYAAALDTLPDGAFITFESQACLVWKNELLAWSPGGYQSRLVRPSGLTVTVLTPPSIVNALLAGYPVDVHESVSVEPKI